MKMAPLLRAFAAQRRTCRARARAHRPALRRRDERAAVRRPRAAARPTSTSKWARARTRCRPPRSCGASSRCWTSASRAAWSSSATSTRRSRAASSRQEGHAGRARRGRAAQLRPRHARGDQPHPHRPDRRRGSTRRSGRRTAISRAKASPPSASHFVGNVMIDIAACSTAIVQWRRGERSLVRASRRRRASPSGFGVVTLHRPSNVDDPPAFGEALAVLRDVSAAHPAGVAAASARARQHRALRLCAAAGRVARSRCCRRRAISRCSACWPGARRAHRFRRHPGGDDGAGGALPHDAREHRASDHRRQGTNTLVGRDRSARRRVRRRDPRGRRQARADARVLGRPRGGADRRGPCRLACAPARSARTAAA